VAKALSDMGWETFPLLDRVEPEYEVLRRLYESSGVRATLVVGMGAAIVDFQLGAGGAEEFWRCLSELLEQKGFALEDLSEARRLLFDFLDRCKANSRLKSLKRERLTKFFEGFAKDLWSEAYEFFNERPDEVWSRLSRSMGGRPEAKTVVFAMKVLDIVSAIATGSYALFRRLPPIPVDEHVRRMSHYSGVVVGEPHLFKAEVYREAWAKVSQEVTKRLGRVVSPLRLDSLLWQLSKEASRHGYAKSRAVPAMAKYLVDNANLPDEVAFKVALELSVNME